MRRVLEELTFEKERTDIKANRCKELEEQVTELRQTNRSLEDKIARLCEAPFISDAFGKTETIRRLEELTKERDDIQGKYEHLQEALRTNYSALTSLKQELSKLREAKENAENNTFVNSCSFNSF